MMDYRELIRITISLHPDYKGIHQCYQEVITALKANAIDFIQTNSISVWTHVGHTGYQVIHSPLPFLHLSEFEHQKISLEIYRYPTNLQEINLIRKHESEDFLTFLKKHAFDLDYINPSRLLFMINSFICPEVLLEINKIFCNKPRPQISLEVLANFLNCSRNQLNFRQKSIKAKRHEVIDKLEQESRVVRRLVNEKNYELSAQDIWGSR